ncbi:hypothetical protein CQA53_02490 [Helicobacter didelphidarum]|uniref:Outer membrane beta-barrel protein n=1 Tax=Helicobacter didelphidarum TaxID=2040648 RepID=A0A3D8IPF2_9HELI|nr:outer membrane beta-barrel protein [Helicobacter didelphidarum]RDU67138.1 hypothetical protein CQA53_02490 [Helicobacter didelphidarum]
MKKYSILYIIIFILFSLNVFGNEESQSLSKNNIKQQKLDSQSGFFIGIHAGVSMVYAHLYDKNGNMINWDNTQNLNFNVNGQSMMIRPNVGLKLGWNQFFNTFFGVRGYINYDYSDYRDTLLDSKIACEDVSANVDVLLDFWNTQNISLGVFVGFGVGYELPQWSKPDVRDNFEAISKYNGFILPVNIGLHISLNHHKIEIGTRIHTIATRYKSIVDSSGFGMQPLIVSVGYIYTF